MSANGLHGVDFSALTKGVRGLVTLHERRIISGDVQYLSSGEASRLHGLQQVTLSVKA